MGATCCGNLRKPGAVLHTFILLTLDFEKKPSLREFLTDALVLVCGAKWAWEAAPEQGHLPGWLTECCQQTEKET
jgi:hypothetical protein